MATSDPNPAREIFDQAADLPADQRGTFLDQACAGDVALRADVESLLAAEDESGAFLAEPPQIPHLPAEGTTIGPYSLMELLGEGGFGHVWRAEQTKPIRRQVALKLLRPEMDSRQIIARFEAEREALAIMDHPGIARVFDAGVTSIGRPYFVMELVRGVPLTQYCDHARLDLRQRMELFVGICQAVQHAHVKGIIHRDLKPGNVLVTEIDGRPVPKIIDFGVAKATAASTTGKQFFTEFRQLLGTPEYMSPEQASMASHDIDTRSDIYSLGVILYELLVGVTPFDAARLREAAYNEMQRIIREVDPPRPSTRFSELRGTLPSIAAVRSIEPATLARRLKGELDWIVMRCLEKQRSRRYTTAASLADDVAAYLEGRNVSAAPPSSAYKFRKFVRRHRFGSAVVAAVAASLLVGLAGTWWQYVQARRARDLAILNQQQAGIQRDEALQQRANVLAVDAFLTEMLGSADPEVSGGKAVTVLEMADRAVADLERRRLDQPLVEASIRTTLCTTYLGLGRFDLAKEQAEMAYQVRRKLLGEDHPDTLASQNNLGAALSALGRGDEAEAVHRAVLEKRLTRGEDGAEVFLSMNNLASALMRKAKADEAETLFRQAYAGRRRVLGQDHPLTIATCGSLAGACLWTAKYDEAESLFRDALERRRRLLGDDHPATAKSVHNLGLAVMSKLKPAEAEPLFRQALKVREATLGIDHPETIDTLRNLGDILRKLKRYDEAAPLLREAAERCRRILGPDHPDTLRADANELKLLLNLHDATRSLPLARDLVERALRVLGPDHRDTLGFRGHLVTALRHAGFPDEAAAVLRQLEADRVRLGLPVTPPTTSSPSAPASQPADR